MGSHSKKIVAGKPRPGPAPAEADIRRVLDSFRRVVRVLRLASREAEKKVGLSAAQLFVLQKLAEARTLSVSDLAERTHTHQSSVSVVVQRLVDRGLVARKRSRSDARQMALSVTRAGRAILRSAPAAAQDQLIAALAAMGQPRVHRLAGALQDLLQRLGIDVAEPATMLFEDDADGPASARRARLTARPRKD